MLRETYKVFIGMFYITFKALAFDIFSAFRLSILLYTRLHQGYMCMCTTIEMMVELASPVVCSMYLGTRFTLI